jgi:phosphomannomutase
MKDKDLIMFDLDGTLVVSKSKMDSAMSVLLIKLISIKKVAIISGSGFPEFERNLLSALPINTPNLSNLILLPTSGTRLYMWKGSWHQEYAENLSIQEKNKIINALETSLKQSGFEKSQKTYGEIIEHTDSQITFSALGQRAPIEEKSKWDPDQTKRIKIIDILKPKIPEFDIKMGGTTSIDITKKGINKSYGIHKLESFLQIPLEKMLFIGDALYPGGNDYPAKATGIDCIQVRDPEETKRLMSDWLV